MSKRFENIDGFVRRVRTRLNRHLGLDILVRCLGAAGAALILVALSYILRGYHVPLFWYPVVLLLALAGGLGWWAVRRRSFDQAAGYTDEHFQLKDAVSSYEGFSRADKHEGIYELQAEHTGSALEQVHAAEVKYRWPLRTALICGALLFSSALLTLRADSPRITTARLQAEQILIETEQINEQIKDALEEIKEEAKNEEIEKLIVPEQLDKMVEELKETPDLKDAMRQYAKLEKQLHKVLSKLEQRKDEQLYQKMGKVLQKHDRAKALGNRLVKKQYKEAAQELQKYKIDKKATPEEQRKQLEKVKSVAKHMAQAAKQNNSSCKAAELAKRLDQAASKPGQASNSSSQGSGSQRPKGAPQNSQSSGAKGSSSKASGAKGASSKGAASGGSGSEGSGSEGEGGEGVNDSLDQMGESLDGLDAKCKAQSAIQSLCKSLSECQGKLGNGSGSGKGKGQGQGDGGGGDCDGDGGLEPGTGHSDRTNSNINNASSTGDKSVLKGQKSQGPSINTTESASDGSGSSAGSNKRLIKQYRHQAESFIRREDVSETVKSGVKEYFESIHRTEEGD